MVEGAGRTLKHYTVFWKTDFHTISNQRMQYLPVNHQFSKHSSDSKSSTKIFEFRNFYITLFNTFDLTPVLTFYLNETAGNWSNSQTHLLLVEH